MMTEMTGSTLLAYTMGWPELAICALVFVLLFGSAKLPSLMRNMGRSINEFKAGMRDKPNTRIENEAAEPEEKVHS